MARKPETVFIGSVHKYLPRKLHHEKMNNPYRSGTADCWYSGVHEDLWIEYKFIPKLLKNEDAVIVPDLTALQLEWLEGRKDEGRNVWVLVGCPTGGVVFTRKEWRDGLSVKQFKDRLCTRKELAGRIYMFTTGSVLD